MLMLTIILMLMQLMRLYDAGSNADTNNDEEADFLAFCNYANAVLLRMHMLKLMLLLLLILICLAVFKEAD